MEKIWEFYSLKKPDNISATLRKARTTFFLSLMSFFLARAVLFQFMNPLFIAFLVNFAGRGNKFYILAGLAVLGIVTRFEGMLLLKNLSALSLIVLGHLLIGVLELKPKGMIAPLIAGIAALFSGLMFAYMFEGGSFFFLMALGASVFAVALAILMKDGAAVLSGRYKENAVDNEDVISLIIIVSASVAGAADIFIGIFSLKYILCAAIILIAARRGGVTAGTTCGVVLAIVLTLLSDANYLLIGVFAAGGLVAGFLANRSKLAAATGFLAGVILSALYLNAELIAAGFFFSQLLGAVLFMLNSDSFSLSFIKPAQMQIHDRDAMVKMLTEGRLRGVSGSFKNMSRTLISYSEKQQNSLPKDLSRLIDDTVAKACKECFYTEDCWGKDFYKTYQFSLRILEDCEKGLSLDYEQLESENLCKYIGYFSSWLSRQYDIYKLNLNWQNQMAESRLLISQQLLGISEIVENLSDEIAQKEIISEYLSQKIKNTFAKKNTEVSNVIVLENAQGKFAVSLERKSCLGVTDCFREAAALVSSCLGRKMIVDKKTCRKGKKHLDCALHFTSEPRYHIVSGAAYAKKDGSNHSGDCHSVMEIRADNIILALSDGMGSGQKARESEAAMGLLEDFLEAGFSRELALRLINSVLVLKDGREHFSTMDICSIDLHSGAAEFIKIGASAAFIKRGSSVAQIVSESLPMGILAEIDAQVCKKTVKSGDIIVMLTDGVYDSGYDEYDRDIGRNWVAQALEEFDAKDPDDIAEYLIAMARSRSNEQIKDDMTVLCAKVWEKTGS